MGIIAKLQWGSRELDIAASPYSLYGDFVPPALSESANMAIGTSANRHEGGEVVSYKAQDRGWGFSVRVLGTASTQTHADAQRIRDFLRLCKDKRHKLYFVYKPNNDYDFEPLWGQYGGTKKYHIKIATASLGRMYSSSIDGRGKTLRVRLSLTIAPYAAGREQLLGSALGAILEDTIGTADGSSRGLMVLEGETNINHYSNPIFGHATFDTGWTVNDASLLKLENKDDNFILWQGTSVKLINTAGASTRDFRQTINTGTTASHTMTFYVKRSDGEEVTSSDAQLTKSGAVQTTTFLALANGWYRMLAEVAGVVGNVVYGIGIKPNRTLYVAGAQIGSRGAGNTQYGRPLAHGDQLGCSWVGTAHNSKTTRANGRLRFDFDDTMSQMEGVVRVILKWNIDSLELVDNSQVIFEDSNDNFLAMFHTDKKYYLQDGTNSASGNVIEFSINQIDILHFVYGPNIGLKIYRNGVIYGTNATYTPPTTPTYFYLGTSDEVSGHLEATIMGLGTFDRDMTATEVLADYNNINAHVSAGDGLGRRLESIPWLWTKDGDNVVDMYDDSTHDDFAVVGGIPGSEEADTVWHFTNSAADRSLIVGLFPFDRYIDPGTYFSDESGTAEGTALGTAVLRLAVTTGNKWGTTITLANLNEIMGQQVFIFASIIDRGGGTNLSVRPQIDSSGGTVVIGKWKSITATTSLKQFLIGPINVPFDINKDYKWAASPTFTMAMQAKFGSGNANVDLDFWRLIFGKLAQIPINEGNSRGVFLHGDEAYGLLVTTSAVEEYTKVGGSSEIFLVPDKINHLIILSGDEGAATSLTATVAITRVFVTPRWSLV